MMEMLISGGDRDAQMQKALAGGLRRRQEISELGQMTGDRIITPMAQQLGQGVQRDISTAATQTDRAAQRKLTAAHYETVASQSALANTMAQNRLDETIRHNRATEERQLLTANKTLNSDVRRLSAALTKANSAEITSGIANIDEELAPYLEAGGNLPGVGGISNILPGFTSEARQMQARLAKIRGIILKARSGGAVTPEEAARLNQEFSRTAWNSDEEFLKAWDDFKNAYAVGIANIHAGYTDEVNEMYRANFESQMRNTGEQDTPVSAGASPEVTPPSAPPGGVQWGDL